MSLDLQAGTQRVDRVGANSGQFFRRPLLICTRISTSLMPAAAGGRDGCVASPNLPSYSECEPQPGSTPPSLACPLRRPIACRNTCNYSIPWCCRSPRSMIVPAVRSPSPPGSIHAVSCSLFEKKTASSPPSTEAITEAHGTLSFAQDA